MPRSYYFTDDEYTVGILHAARKLQREREQALAKLMKTLGYVTCHADVTRSRLWAVLASVPAVEPHTKYKREQELKDHYSKVDQAHCFKGLSFCDEFQWCATLTFRGNTKAGRARRAEVEAAMATLPPGNPRYSEHSDYLNECHMYASLLGFDTSVSEGRGIQVPTAILSVEGAPVQGIMLNMPWKAGNPPTMSDLWVEQTGTEQSRNMSAMGFD